MALTTLTATRPDWYASVSPERQGLWAAGDSKWHIGAQAGYAERVRVVLKDGTILDGAVSDERNRWDSKHALAIRMRNRKTQKWIPVADIAVIWGDKGRPLADMLADYIRRGVE